MKTLGSGCTPLLASLLLLVSSCATVGAKMPLLDADSPEALRLRKEVDAQFLPLVESSRLMGASVGVVTESGTLFLGYGRVSSNSSETPDADTVFEIGSVTKVFNTLMLVLAEQRGALALGDPVGKQIPDLAVDLTWEEVPVRWVDLAVHISGLPRVPGDLDLTGLDPYAGYTEAKLLALLKTGPFVRKPGLKYEYSNLGSGLLGYLLSRLSGLSWQAMFRAQVAVPLGLNETTVALSDDQKSRLATGYFYDAAAGLEAVPMWTFDVLAGAGALRSTCRDMLHFVALSIGLLKSPMEAAMTAMLEDKVEAEGEGMRMALGWHLVQGKGLSFYWKDGGTYGANSFLAFSPGKRIGIVVLSNTFGLDAALATASFKLIARLAADPVERLEPGTSATSTTASPWSGPLGGLARGRPHP